MSDGLLAVPVPSQQRRGVPAPADPAALLAAAEADADALADRLHDGALQALVVARYATDAAVRGADPVLARDAVQEALVALRRTVWLLRPRGGDGLGDALTELSKRLVAAGGPVLELAVDDVAAGELPAPARALAYRFVQDAAGETAAAGATVRLGREGAYAVLSVTGTVAPGWVARAAALGGSLDCSGDCSDGTARLRLPLTLADSDPEGDR